MDLHEILIIEHLSKICRENSSFVKIHREIHLLYIKT
jgi:hypothetical protein